jgi:hypothetical protein
MTTWQAGCFYLTFTSPTKAMLHKTSETRHTTCIDLHPMTLGNFCHEILNPNSTTFLKDCQRDAKELTIRRSLGWKPTSFGR